MICELCAAVGGQLLWKDSLCRVALIDEPGYAGYCRVIWNSHVAEMTDLSDADRAHCMRVVLAVESVLRELLAPDKINLASLGNFTPHVHWHVIPRFHDDPHFPQAIWAARQREAPSRAVAADLHDQIARSIATRLHE
jgi:diadenosine tetraphosphate (Ap4A) HIT family hydrolase